MGTVLLLSAALLAGSAAVGVAQDSSATVKLSDVAGVWDYRATVGVTSRVVVASVLTTTATKDGWTIQHANEDAVPVRVLEVAGDSIVAEAGPYSSTLRPRQMGVGASMVMRLHIVLHYDGGDTMNGVFEAHYSSGDVMSGTVDAVRNP